MTGPEPGIWVRRKIAAKKVEGPKARRVRFHNLPPEAQDDCESTSLQCLSTGAHQPKVCLAQEEAADIDVVCRQDLNEAWSVDACGNFLENSGDVAVAYACREDTDQSWSIDACGNWIEVAEDCGEGYRCENNQCISRVPDIEVSPTLLQYDTITVGQSKTLTLSIGNLGDGTLVVDEIVINSETPEVFSVSQDSLEVSEGEIVSIDVTFTPKAEGSMQALIVIHSNDPDEAEISILVNGAAVSS